MKTLPNPQKDTFPDRRFELAVASTNDGIWDWDSLNDTLWLSARCKSMLGYGESDLVRCGIKDWYQLILAEDRFKARQFIEGYITGKPLPAVTLRFCYRTGATLYLMCRASALRDESGKVVRLVGVHTDVTDIVAMQEAYRQERDRAQAASRAKSDFLANMSHEIRTPMNAILGMIDLLLETPLDAQQYQWAEIARTSSESLLAIINDILDLSKIEEGRLELERVPFDLFAMVEQLADTLSFRTRGTSLELLTHFKEGTPRFVIGDQARLRDILTNLIGNAIKFTTEGHVAVTLSGEVIDAGIAKITLEVSDTGIGIPQDKQEYIFEKFSQAEESTTRKFGGTGLGLAICRRLVHMMNGTITVKSQLGLGASFIVTVTLPVDAAQRDKSEGSFPPLKIAVIDDNKKSLSILHSYFNSWGLQNQCFSDPGLALAPIIEAHRTGKPFDIAFIDYHLPSTKLRSLMAGFKDAGLSLKPVALKNGAGGHLQQLKDEGFFGLVNKPFSPVRLKRKLQALSASSPSESLMPEKMQTAQSQDYSKLRVLVVEDLKANQIYLESVLKKYQCPVAVASNGAEAVEMVRANPFDVIFMDCQMPVMDGFEATQAIRALSLPRQPFIVALTADALRSDHERCLKAGMDEYLNKPVKADRIAGMLDRSLAR